MNKARNKFVLYAMFSVFVLLTLLLAIINGVNFTMVSEDADRITEMLCEKHGMFPESGVFGGIETNDTPMKRANDFSQGNREFRKMGPMGPDSPDMSSSLRYFTYAFDKKGGAQLISFHISAVDDEEALQWAKSLSDEKGTGWTQGTYRYRVYKDDKKTFVIIIDQGRELLPSYRILIISVIGEVIGLLISFAFLSFIGKSLFGPLEEADRKQKRFISKIESEFKVPLTVINADTELIERESGSSDYTKSINRQVRKMTALVKDIGSLAIFEESDKRITKVNLSSTLSFVIDSKRAAFTEKGVELKADIDDGIIIDAEDKAIKQIFSEICENAVKYSEKTASFSLKKNDDRISFIAVNDTKLPNGGAEQVFDRFTTLPNADDTAVGLGLSHVKEMVHAHNGRVSARIVDGMFELTIAL